MDSGKNIITAFFQGLNKSKIVTGNLLEARATHWVGFRICLFLLQN